MRYPEFIQSYPELDVPFPRDMVRTHAVQSDTGLVVFFEILQDVELPMHSHKAQWGTVIHGEIDLTIGDTRKVYRTGESYNIPAGVEHGGFIKAGSLLLDAFEEPDRYQLKG